MILSFQQLIHNAKNQREENFNIERDPESKNTDDAELLPALALAISQNTSIRNLYLSNLTERDVQRLMSRPIWLKNINVLGIENFNSAAINSLFQPLENKSIFGKILGLHLGKLDTDVLKVIVSELKKQNNTINTVHLHQLEPVVMSELSALFFSPNFRRVEMSSLSVEAVKVLVPYLQDQKCPVQSLALGAFDTTAVESLSPLLLNQKLRELGLVAVSDIAMIEKVMESLNDARCKINRLVVQKCSPSAVSSIVLKLKEKKADFRLDFIIAESSCDLFPFRKLASATGMSIFINNISLNEFNYIYLEEITSDYISTIENKSYHSEELRFTGKRGGNNISSLTDYSLLTSLASAISANKSIDKIGLYFLSAEFINGLNSTPKWRENISKYTIVQLDEDAMKSLFNNPVPGIDLRFNLTQLDVDAMRVFIKFLHGRIISYYHVELRKFMPHCLDQVSSELLLNSPIQSLGLAEMNSLAINALLPWLHYSSCKIKHFTLDSLKTEDILSIVSALAHRGNETSIQIKLNQALVPAIVISLAHSQTAMKISINGNIVSLGKSISFKKPDTLVPLNNNSSRLSINAEGSTSIEILKNSNFEKDQLILNLQKRIAELEAAANTNNNSHNFNHSSIIQNNNYIEENFSTNNTNSNNNIPEQLFNTSQHHSNTIVKAVVIKSKRNADSLNINSVSNNNTTALSHTNKAHRNANTDSPGNNRNGLFANETSEQALSENDGVKITQVVLAEQPLLNILSAAVKVKIEPIEADTMEDIAQPRL